MYMRIWTYQVQDRPQWKALVNMIIDFSVLLFHKRLEVVLEYLNISSPRMTLPHGVSQVI